MGEWASLVLDLHIPAVNHGIIGALVTNMEPWIPEGQGREYGSG